MLTTPFRALYNRSLFHVGRRVRTRHVLAAVRASAPKSGRILDAGCGNGELTFLLARRYPHLEVEGLELEPEKVARGEASARRLGLRNLRFRAGDVTRIDRRGHYDLVLSVDVLEHVKDDEAAIGLLADCLRPGGLLVLHTPRSSPRRFFAAFHDHHQADHVRDGYEPEMLANRLGAAGFDPITVRRTFGAPGELAWEIMHWIHRDPKTRARDLAGVALSPLLLLLCELDYRLGGGAKGNGLLVLARRAPVAAPAAKTSTGAAATPGP